MTIHEPPRLDAEQDAALAGAVREIEEAAGGQPWTLVGAASVRLQGIEEPSPSLVLEFVTTEQALRELAAMLPAEVGWRRGEYVAAPRIRYERGAAVVFVHGNPTFHGAYVSLTPIEIPSLWDARAEVAVRGARVFATPLEWELLLAAVLGNDARASAVGAHLRGRGHDGRLLTRLMREGHVGAETEEAVWGLLER